MCHVPLPPYMRAADGCARFFLLVTIAGLATALAQPVIAGTVPTRDSPASADVALAFPSLTTENQSAELAALFSQELGLGANLASNATPIGQLYPMDGLGNMLTNRPNVLVQDVVEVSTEVGATVELYYASPGGPSSHFVYATVWSMPVNASLRADPRHTLGNIATALGVPLNGTEKTLQYDLGDQNRTTIYRPYSGKGIEFADQVMIVFYQGDNSMASLWLYPWIQQIPSPAASESVAFATALARVNGTYVRDNYTLNRWSAQFALDARSFVFAYSFRLWYAGKDFSMNGDLDATVWLDAATGGVLLVDVANLVPQSGGPPSFWSFLQVMVLVLASAVLVALGLVSALDEGARLLVLNAVAFPFFSLRREQTLDHFVRGQIYEHLRSHPGATFTEIKDHLSLNNGTAAHHLMVLDKMGFVLSKRDGRTKRFFRVDAPTRLVPSVLSPLQYNILNLLAQEPLSQADLARRLASSKQRVSYNVKRLRRDGYLGLGKENHVLHVTAKGTATLSEQAAAVEP